MAVDLCRDNSSRGLGFLNLSPRISFSYDLNQSDIVPIETLQSSLLHHDFDFDFCVSKRLFDHDSSLADELFANGIILPAEIKHKDIPRKSVSASCSPLSAYSIPSRFETEESKETEEKQGNNSSSFWKFKRSKSFNCRNLYKKGLLWPLPLLSRSKSTGSTPSDDKESLSSKDQEGSINRGLKLKQSHQKKTSAQQNHQKPPLKKNYGSSSSTYNYGGVNPVLNVPTEKLLGLASIFSHGKDKGKKK